MSFGVVCAGGVCKWCVQVVWAVWCVQVVTAHTTLHDVLTLSTPDQRLQ